MTISIPANGSSVYVPPGPDYWGTSNDNIKYTIRVRLNWQSIPENRSSIHVDVIAWRRNTGYTTYGSGTAYFQNGANQSWDSQSITPSQTITYNSDTVLLSRDVFVYHDANGNATTQLGAYFSIPSIVSATPDHYESISLPQIPRNALLDSVTGATKFGDTATLSMSRILAGRYYKLEVLHGSTVIDTTNFVSTSVPASKEMEVDWQEYNTTSQSTTLTLRLTTYSDLARTVQVGSPSSKNITLSPSADANPTFTFNDLVHNGTLSTPNVPNIWNAFVQNKSGAVATISSLSAKYGASITSVVITGNGESASGTSGSTTLTTGPLATAGTMTFTAVVTDSRGLTATAHKSITVAAYKAPVIHTMLSKRSDISGTAISDGTYMLALCDYSFSAVGSNSALCEVWTRPSNTDGAVFLQVDYRLGGTWVPDIGIGDDAEVATLTRNSDTDPDIDNSFLTDQSYDVRYIVRDALSVSYKDDVLSISRPAMEFSMAGEVGIGCEPVAGKALAVGGDMEVKGESLFLASHPIGSLFLSMDSTNPGTLFGGTWALVSAGRMLVGVNPNDTDFNTAGKTGGSKNLQQHSHGYTDATPQAHTHGLSAGHGRITTVGNDVRYRYKSVSSWTANYRMTGSSSGSNSNTHTDGIELGGTTDSTTNTSDVSRTTGNSGTGASQNMPPYLACYIWKRTA